VGSQYHLGGGAEEGGPSGQQLVGNSTDGVDVGPVVDVGIGCCLLRRHVGGGAQGDSSGGQLSPTRGFTHGFRHTEIRHQRMAMGQHDVVRLYIPVDDTLFVGVGQGIHHVPQYPHGLCNREFAFSPQLLPQ